MMDDLVIQVRYRLQTLPSEYGGVVDRNRHRIRHRIPRDRILSKTTRQQGLLEGSHLDDPDPRTPDLTSGPYLILEEQVVELLPPVLSSLGPSLYLKMLRVRLVAVVMGYLVSLVIKASPRWNRIGPVSTLDVTIASTRTDVAASVIGSDRS